MVIRLILLFVLFITSCYSIPNNDVQITLTSKQIQVLKHAYNEGNSFKIGNERYGITLATIVMLESSAGISIVDTKFTSFGVTQIKLNKARELLQISDRYYYLNKLPDGQLIWHLVKNNTINMHLCMLNFKQNFNKHKSYIKAIKAHNGYAPSIQIYNKQYYKKFTETRSIIEQLIKQEKI